MAGCLRTLLGFLLGILTAIYVLPYIFEREETVDSVEVAEEVVVEAVREVPQPVESSKKSTKKEVAVSTPKQEKVEVVTPIVKMESLEQLGSAFKTGEKITQNEVKPTTETTALMQSNSTNQQKQTSRSDGFNIKRVDGKTVVLYLGMSKREIIELLGEPESFRTYSYLNREELEYVTGNNKYRGLVPDLTLELEDGKLSNINKL